MESKTIFVIRRVKIKKEMKQFVVFRRRVDPGGRVAARDARLHGRERDEV